jgi:hypothetical protein
MDVLVMSSYREKSQRFARIRRFSFGGMFSGFHESNMQEALRAVLRRWKSLRYTETPPQALRGSQRGFLVNQGALLP